MRHFPRLQFAVAYILCATFAFGQITNAPTRSTSRRAVATGFAAPSGTFGWFRADTLALSNNDPVSTWPDSSTGGHTLSNTGSARPTFHTAILNGLPGVFFDGTNDYLVSGTFSSIAQPFTMMFVALWGGGATVYAFDGADNHRAMIWGSSTSINLYSGAFVFGPGAAFTIGSAHQITVVVNGASSEIYLDGALNSSGNGGTNDLVQFFMGSAAEAAAFGYLTMCEFLIRSGGRDTATEAYLKAKYATP